MRIDDIVIGADYVPNSRYYSDPTYRLRAVEVAPHVRTFGGRKPRRMVRTEARDWDTGETVVKNYGATWWAASELDSFDLARPRIEERARINAEAHELCDGLLEAIEVAGIKGATVRASGIGVSVKLDPEGARLLIDALGFAALVDREP